VIAALILESMFYRLACLGGGGRGCRLMEKKEKGGKNYKGRVNLHRYRGPDFVATSGRCGIEPNDFPNIVSSRHKGTS